MGCLGEESRKKERKKLYEAYGCAGAILDGARASSMARGVSEEAKPCSLVHVR